MSEEERRDAGQGCRTSALWAVIVRGYPGGDAGHVEDMPTGEAGQGQGGGEESVEADTAPCLSCHHMRDMLLAPLYTLY